MKKKLLGILFCGILLAGLTGCNSKIDQNVNLSVKEGTLTNSSVTLILKNDSKTKCTQLCTFKNNLLNIKKRLYVLKEC